MRCSTLVDLNLTIRNSTLSMAIYDDRFEIWNIGKLPLQLAINNLREPHGSYPRNETIANVLDGLKTGALGRLE